MKKEEAVVLSVGIVMLAMLLWLLLKDKEEVFLSLTIAGLGTFAAGGRTRQDGQVLEGEPGLLLN